VLKVLAILGGALFTVGSSWAAGKFIFDRLRLRFHPLEELFFRFVLGAAAFSLIVFCLAAAHLARTWVFLVAGAIPMVLAARSRNTGEKPDPLPPLSLAWKLAFAIVFTVYGVFYLVNAMAPEASPDGSTYHLGLVARYLRQHGFGQITTDMYANLSQGVEMLFLPAFAIGKHSAAAMVEFAFLAALPLGMLSYSRRFGYPVAGVVGALLTFTSPLFGVAGTTAYNDVAGVCVIFGVFYLLQIWLTSGDNRLIPLMGVLGGFAYGIKYTLFLAVPYAGSILIWKLWRTRRPLVQPVAIFCGCALLMMTPWMLKNWITVANPFSPFLNSLFPNPYVTIYFERNYVDLMRNYQHLTPQVRIAEALCRGDKTGGFLGPVFLFLPVGLLALRWRAGRQLILAGALFFLPGLTNIQARFLMPCVPFFSLAFGIAVAQIPVLAWAFILVPAVLGWPTVYKRYCVPYAWRIEHFPLKAALRKIPEAKTLDQTLPDIALARMIEQLVPATGRVFSFGTPPEAYTSREIVIGYESAAGNRLVDLFEVALTADFQPTRFLTFSFHPTRLQKVRIVQTGQAEEDRWSIGELRVFHGDSELPRSPEWHLNAQPNPWDIGYAFDNNPVTRWNSQQVLYPGMEVTIDFGSEQNVDRVVLECSHDQWKTRFKLQGASADGIWKDLAGEPRAEDRSSDWNLRGAAVQAARESGITHILVLSSDFGADDFSSKRQEWGLEVVGATGKARLYRLR
jgi:hypothetical protein